MKCLFCRLSTIAVIFITIIFVPETYGYNITIDETWRELLPTEGGGFPSTSSTGVFNAEHYGTSYDEYLAMNSDVPASGNYSSYQLYGYSGLYYGEECWPITTLHAVFTIDAPVTYVASFSVTDPVSGSFVNNQTEASLGVVDGSEVFGFGTSSDSSAGILDAGQYSLDVLAGGRHTGVNLMTPPDFYYVNFDLQMSEVPIPGAIWLLGSGFIGLVGLRRKLRK